MIQVKVRRVATPAGEARYHLPIHSIIGADYVPNIPVGTPLGVDRGHVGRMVRYVGPDAPAHNPVDVVGTLVRIQRGKRTKAQIRDRDGVTHVFNVDNTVWDRMSHPVVPIEPTEYQDWNKATVNGKPYTFGLYNRRWYVLEGDDFDWDREVGRFKTANEAAAFLEDMAVPKPKPPRRVSRVKQAKAAADTDFPDLIQRAINEENLRRSTSGKAPATDRDITAIKRPFLAEMKRRKLEFFTNVRNYTWVAPLQDSPLKHMVLRKKNKHQLISELGVIYEASHIGPVVKIVEPIKVLQATLESIVAVLHPVEVKYDAAQALDDLQSLIEQKSIIRHVATKEGVLRYHRPIGAVIVARDDDKGIGEQLAFIWRDRGGKKDADGFVSYTGSDDSPIPRFDKNGNRVKSQAAKYKVKQTSRNKWVAIDETGKQVATGKDELAILTALNDHTMKVAMQQHDTSRRGSGWMKETDPKTGKVRIVVGHRKPKKGMHRATGEELVKLGNAGMNRRFVDIFLYDDPTDKKAYGYGYDRNGGPQSYMKTSAVIATNKQKFANVDKMEPKMPAWEQMLADHWQDNDTNKALWLMTVFALRVGTDAAARKQKKDQNPGFGATKITRRMVKRSTRTSVTLEIPSKSPEPAIIHATMDDDPVTVGIIHEAMKGKKPDDPLFPDTNEGMTEEVGKAHFGDWFNNHNLRHYRATEAATAIIQDWLGQGYPEPQSYKELVDEWAKPLGEIVEREVLFDKAGEGWRSYIDPNVLAPLCKKDPSWITTFAEKHQGKGID